VTKVGITEVQAWEVIDLDESGQPKQIRLVQGECFSSEPAAVIRIWEWASEGYLILVKRQ
jgi:hypothetical protein